MNQPVTVDGDLSEDIWQQAEVTREFRQIEPNQGAAPSETTEVRVLYDEKNLYLGILAFDTTPDNINARELARDSSFSNDDRISILIDTFYDRRNGYRFSVNPLGTQQDALVSDDGRSINTTWDALWFAAGKITPQGYAVEIAIPLTSLRFLDGIPNWGFNVSRVIRRKNEEVLLASWVRSFGLERVSQAGNLAGMEDLHRPRLVEVKPYLTGGWRQGVPLTGQPGFDAGLFGQAGIEVARIGITPSLTAEFTANPDFGQAEVDGQVVNLTRFSVFFPERRDFFLENIGVFFFGREGINQLFFTRRIGLTTAGAPVPIDYGVKVTGRQGPFNVGFLHVQTRPQAGGNNSTPATPRQQFTVFRVKRDIPKNSYFGAIVANRQGGTQTSFNRSAGLDTLINLTKYWRLNGFAAATATPGVTSSFTTGRLTSSYRDNRVSLDLLAEHIGKNYNPELGFVARTGVRQYFGNAAYRFRPSNRHIREIEFTSFYEYYQDENQRAGKLQSRQFSSGVNIDLQNSASFSYRPVERVTDVLTVPFAIRPGIVIPKGSYSFSRQSFQFSSNQSRKLILSLREAWGEFYTGQRVESSATIVFRPNTHFSFEATESHNLVRLPQGNFSTNLLSSRLTYNLSNKLLTSTLVQLNSAAKLTSLNFRLRYIYRPNSDFFLIFNHTTGQGLERPSFQLQFKLTYYWRK
ncbi:MAG: carbohydrate binding family 9 domain-containing protein [Blastocatellia bacterium]|nr:carbohydrate binding family 9 domain-containing protein [Blastocatellia bacterium]